MPKFKNIDMSNAAQVGSYDLVPMGWYKAKADMADDTETKAKKEGKVKKGMYCKVRFKITDEKCTNRTIFCNFNFENENEEAEQIGKGQLNAFAIAATGRKLEDLNDEQDLLDRELFIKVGIQKGSGGYEDSNSVNGYKELPNKVNATPAAPTPTPNENAVVDEDDVPF